MSIAAGGALAALVIGVILMSANRGNAASEDDSDSRIRQGFAIAPVELNLQGKNRALVGLGSYLVNAAGGCNDCHTNPPYAVGGNPFMGEPKKVSRHVYLGGGNLFIPANPPLPEIVSRNITPDKTGLPAGVSFQQFLSILRTGLDPKKAHPQYGPYLQVMPWPVYQDLVDIDIRAIYEYLSTIPCVEGYPGLPERTGKRCT
jgi:hypothetical protein